MTTPIRSRKDKLILTAMGVGFLGTVSLVTMMNIFWKDALYESVFAFVFGKPARFVIPNGFFQQLYFAGTLLAAGGLMAKLSIRIAGMQNSPDLLKSRISSIGVFVIGIVLIILSFLDITAVTDESIDIVHGTSGSTEVVRLSDINNMVVSALSSLGGSRRGGGPCNLSYGIDLYDAKRTYSLDFNTYNRGRAYELVNMLRSRSVPYQVYYSKDWITKESCRSEVESAFGVKF